MRFSGWVLATFLVIPAVLPAQTAELDSMTSGQSPQISIQAQHFLNVLASEDASEIALAQLALRKSNNPQVKQYARSKILAADPAMKQGAIQIAKQKHAVVTGFPSSTAEAEYYYLSKLSGKDFDAAYANYEDAQQRADIILVQNEAKSAKDPQVKSFAQKEAAPVREAADAAQALAQALIS